MTKTFSTAAAQGDFVIIRVDDFPAGVTPVPAENGEYVVAHSETGHNHVMDARHVAAFAPKKPDIYTLFLQVDEQTDIVHLRSFDTHEALRVGKGKYMVRRQREYTPEGFRRAQD
jgi:hypothetical protein